MRYSGKVTIVGALLALILSACSDDSAYDPEWGSDDLLAGGKADSLLDIARQIEFGETVTGSVGDDQVNVYKLEFLAADQFMLEKTVTTGDLNPHLTLFLGTYSHISSQDWERDGNVLRKWYRVEEAGTYMLAVRAYQQQGRGDYSLTATCLGGPCSGDYEDPGRPLTPGEAAECISQARRCAFERLPRFNGAVGQVRALQLMDECLGEATLPEGWSCRVACDTVYDGAWTQPGELCGVIREALIFYADQTEACVQVLSDCLDTCYDEGQYYDYNDSEDFYDTHEAICFMTGFNGQCDGFARDHTECGGGEYSSGTIQECFGLCDSTSGAWVDDLDTICFDTCEHMCWDTQEDCRQQCGTDGTCYTTCMGDLYDYCD